VILFQQQRSAFIKFFETLLDTSEHGLLQYKAVYCIYECGLAFGVPVCLFLLLLLLHAANLLLSLAVEAISE
jgi:hypothetical protein